MAKAYSWTTAETMNTESMAAARNLFFDSCSDQRQFGSEFRGLAGSAGVKLSKSTLEWGRLLFKANIWALFFAHPEEVSVSVVIQPVVNHHIPGAIIVGKGCRVPPVLKSKNRYKIQSNFKIKSLIWSNIKQNFQKNESKTYNVWCLEPVGH